jgi:hypothetical protein
MYDCEIVTPTTSPKGQGWVALHSMNGCSGRVGGISGEVLEAQQGRSDT